MKKRCTGAAAPSREAKPKVAGIVTAQKATRQPSSPNRFASGAASTSGAAPAASRKAGRNAARSQAA